MKNTAAFVSALCVIMCFFFQSIFAQNYADTTTLPQITIYSPNGYGPFTLSGHRSNLFVIYNFPTNTHKVIVKMIDSKGNQINNAYTESGSSLSTVSWSFEADTMGFPLSPQLNLELYYQEDSIAVYKIPYTVYPDTLVVNASEGWGPFVSNNYTFSGTQWEPVPELENTISVSNLPPRTDTVAFKIFDADSLVIASHMVTAPQGAYLDSAKYPNIRMDNLPINTGYLDITIRCEGGPKKGLHYPKELKTFPHQPILKYHSVENDLTDSVPPFVQNQSSGQSLALDSVKYAKINNVPGLWSDAHGVYAGPYSIDLLESSFSFEAWIKFDFEQFCSEYKTQTIFSVDSVFSFYLSGYTLAGGYSLFVQSTLPQQDKDLWTVEFPASSINSTDWHHIAFTCYYHDQQNYPTGKFYIDGDELQETVFHQDNYDFIITNSYLYYIYRKTQPLYIGNYPAGDNFLFDAIDEVRFWSKALTQEEIVSNNRHAPLQSPELLGYWNFDDLRNRLNIISDKSYSNNRGTLHKGAYFLPQDPNIQICNDTIHIFSSALETDSVHLQFVNAQTQIIDQISSQTQNGVSTFIYNMASLPYTISDLYVVEFFNEAHPEGMTTTYPLTGLAPKPIATPEYNWNTYYPAPEDYGKTWAPITVSNFPENTQKVIVGLKKGDQEFDTLTYTQTSLPFHAGLALNGSNNYIKTSEQINAPEKFTIMFWMKTTTKEGARIVSFSDSQNGMNDDILDRSIILKPDGTIEFQVLSPDTTLRLYGLNINNDGEWHHIAATAGENTSALLYVDGSMVDDRYIDDTHDINGWWIFGKNVSSKNDINQDIAEYFDGTLADIRIFNKSLSYEEINMVRFVGEPQSHEILHYKLNEGSGTDIHDNIGTNVATVMGSLPVWTLAKELMYVNWNKNILNHEPGTYTLFARQFYPDGPSEGAEYSLGNFLIKDSYPGTTFEFALALGQGYFNEGIALDNPLIINTDTTYQGNIGWDRNFIGYKFFDPDHQIIAEDYEYYTTPPGWAEFSIDMGDAPQGSYISVESGYKEDNGTMVTYHTDAIPIYIHPLTPPQGCFHTGTIHPGHSSRHHATQQHLYYHYRTP